MEQKYDLIGQRQIRIEKAQKLKSMGIDPYPSKSYRDSTTQNVIENFDQLQGKTVTVGGRITSYREHGQLKFANILDQSGELQLYIRKDTLLDTSPENGNLGFEDLYLLDLGDIIEAKGTVTKTKTGQVSVLVSHLRLLTKSIRPLPDKWKGLQDKEKIFRQRYLDMIMNPEHKSRFIHTAQITYAIREFLNQKGFLEIKTPILQPLYGGGMAKPFTTNLNALNTDYYLAISHELYLKRLITAGFENVYNIIGYFRNEGIDRTHNPEFQMLETMTAFKNYEYNMDLTEEMYKYIANKVFNKTNFKVKGHDVDFAKDWPRIKMIDAVKSYAGYDFESIKNLDQAYKVLEELKINERPDSIGEAMVLVFEEKVEEQLIEPTFIYGHPVEISPLAKRMSSDPRFVERFEVFIGGTEAGDNWTELNDPLELFDRFKDQYDRRAHGQEETHPVDIDFIETMEYGMPPTTGLGPGIERLSMMFTETEYIDDVLFFPMMRPAQPTTTQKEIYGGKYLSKNSSSRKQDFSKKLVLLINPEIEGWKKTNTIAHLSAYLGNQIKKDEFSSKESFTLKDGSISTNSQYPIVTLSAKPQQLMNLIPKIEESGLTHLIFTKEMVESSNDEEISLLLAQKSKSEIDIYGIGIFGDKDIIDQLTKKFSLLKS